MNVTCPDCRSIFRVDPAKVPLGGVRARCSVCGGVIAVSAPEFATAAVGDESSLATNFREIDAPSGVAPFGALESVGEVSGMAFESDIEAMPEPVVSEPEPEPAPPPRPRAATPAFIPPPRPKTPAFTPSRAPTPVSTPPISTAPRPEVPPLPPPMPGSGPGSTPRPFPSVGVSGSSPRAPFSAPARPTMSPRPPMIPPPPPAPRPSGSVPFVPPTAPARPTPMSPMPPAAPRVTQPRTVTSQPFAPPAAPPRVPPLVPAVPRDSAATPIAPQPPVPNSGAPVPDRAAKRTPNPFLANDPNQKAKRLARALVSDMVAYLPQKREEGLKNNTLKQLFREEIKKSYEEYVDQIGKEFAESTTHFQDALNDLLAGGKKMF